MQKRLDIRTDIFATPAFLASLGLLMLNDHYLKSHYPGFITGKLSDFAGLFFFTLFLYAFFPRRKHAVVLLIIAFFLWWKSPFSDIFIDLWNDYVQIFKIGRVVDYTDYVALIMVPVAMVYADGKFVVDCRKLVVAPLVVISILAILGTSRVKDSRDLVLKQTNADRYKTVESVNKALKEVFFAEGFSCRKCDVESESMLYYSNNESKHRSIDIETRYDRLGGVVYIRFSHYPETSLSGDHFFNKSCAMLTNIIEVAFDKSFIIIKKNKKSTGEADFKAPYR